MQEGAERITQIVMSLRNFSRLDEKECKQVDIHQGLDNTLVILQHRLKAVGDIDRIEVIKSYGQLPPITCYASQLNQVFMNLLSNAIDALENQPSPRVITISTSVKDAEEILEDGENFTPSSPHLRTTQRQPLLFEQDYAQGGTSHHQYTASPHLHYIIIRIADNGSGMSEDVRQKIFDPFFTTKPVGSGTGLGLSISYQIVVEKHKGQLNCISVPGEGTEFVIKLPIFPTLMTQRFPTQEGSFSMSISDTSYL